MKFEKFWDKLQHLEEFKPKLIDLDKMDSGEMKLLLEYKMNWAYDDYTFPVVFEIPVPVNWSGETIFCKGSGVVGELFCI